MVFDSELQQQRTIPAPDMGDVWDVAEMRNGDVVIAASNGLYHRRNSECSGKNIYTCMTTLNPLTSCVRY